MAKKSAVSIGISKAGRSSSVRGVCKHTVIRDVRQATLRVKSSFVSTNTKNRPILNMLIRKIFKIYPFLVFLATKFK